MFYAPAILAKKGELSQIWLAAHWQNRLSKQQALSVNIVQSCEAIMNPQAPLSLRLCGQLLHGVARIHQRKVTYLSEECSDALLKIKMAFRPGVVNLSIQETAATPAKINAPALGAGDDDVLPSPLARTSNKNKFANVDPRLEDEWIKLTPVQQHTTRRSITRRTPTLDDSDAKSTTTMDDKEENWSEFPFTAEESSSVEIARKHDDSKSDIATDQQNFQQPYEYENVDVGGDDYYAAPSGTDGGASFSKHSAGGELEEGLMLSGAMNKSWVDDVALLRQEEENQKPSPSRAKKPPKKQGEDEGEKKKRAASTVKRKKKGEAVTELTNEQIQNCLTDVSDITVERKNPRDRVHHDNELREKAFPVQFASTGFDSGMLQPATSGFHPKIVAMFKQNAKPVPAGMGAQETSFEEEDVEVARAKSFTDVSGTGDSGDAGYQTYQYEDNVDVGGDDYRPSFGGTDNEPSHAADEPPDELELTFHESGEPSMTPTRKSESAARKTPTSSGAGENEKWNPQTIKMMRLLREKLTEEPVITYQELAEGQKRTIVAKAFFEILTLSTRSMIRVQQDEPFGQIRIAAGRKYETLLPGEQ